MAIFKPGTIDNFLVITARMFLKVPVHTHFVVFFATSMLHFFTFEAFFAANFNALLSILYNDSEYVLERSCFNF